MLIKSAAVSAMSLGLMVYSAASWTDDVQAAHAAVEGPENRVYEFHQLLKGMMKADNDDELASAAVSRDFDDGGKTCDALSSGPGSKGIVKADYTFFRDRKRLQAFIRSWGKLQDQDLLDVSIKFDMDYPPADCGTATQPCVAAPFCPATNPRRCDKVKGAPCTSCN